MRRRPAPSEAPVSQPAEEGALKAPQCGFESHRGHVTKHHSPDDHGDLAQLFSQEHWDRKYAESHRIWSGEPNLRLVERAADLPPGRALDVGCGEGADAVWLASRGWHVVALDVSTVALERAAEHAREAGVADRVETRHHDLVADLSLPGGFDLVTAHYLHVPREIFADLYRAMAAAVAPGGSLLVVGHHPDDVRTAVRRPPVPDLLFTTEEVVAVLDPAAFDVLLADAPTRQERTHEGSVTVRDSVVHAVRRS